MSNKPVSRVLSHTRRALPRLPHPSWQLVYSGGLYSEWALSGGEADRSPVGSADDFWSRLGL